MISYIVIILRPLLQRSKNLIERGEFMDHKSPLVSWNVFGFDIVFNLASVLMVVITAILVLF